MTGAADPLLARARAGDRDALGALWREHRGWLAAVVLAQAPRGSELDDLLQEVATKVIQQIGTLRDPERLRPWLRAVAINVARSAGRAARARAGVRPLADAHADLPDPRANGARLDAWSAMERVAALPADYREALLLQAVRGLSQREIANALDVPETTVETRLARARRMLRSAEAESQR